jgi:hypothetical protein
MEFALSPDSIAAAALVALGAFFLVRLQRSWRQHDAEIAKLKEGKP